MRIEVIDNRGPNTLLAALRASLGKSSRLDAQAAFVSADGVGEVLPHLRRAAARGKVRIVTGLYQAVSEPSALRLLLTAQGQTKGRLEVRIARDLRFHRKVYVLRGGKTCSIISGSSNLTGEGLKSAGEFNILVQLPSTTSLARRVVSDFDRLWNSGTVRLTADLIKRYEKVRPRRPRPTPLKRSLARVLGPSPGDAGSPDNRREQSRRYWRDYTSGFAAKRTEAVVSDETNWNQKGYFWYSSHSDVFKQGDHILLFDEPTGWAELVVVKDTTRTATPTPDGRHFVACQRLRARARRRLNRGLWKRFRDFGLAISPAERQRRRQLTEGQWGRIAAIFQR
ncbi:MAG TPA: phospholipase D-like domain-containing protein [Candidatus Acidoferrales bacterium]|nr:phospholipase D-like domain-containing protein [Candidatus Acidoferrales bacterium]